MFRKHLAGERPGLTHYFESLAPRPKLALDLTTLPFTPELKLDFGSGDVLRHYSRGVDRGLVQEISRFEGVEPETIMVTSGADMGLEMALTHLLDPGDDIGINAPAFPRFGQIAAELCGARVKFFGSVGEIPKAKVVVINTPNNPSTKMIMKKELEEAISSNSGAFFIIDGVFSAFEQPGLASLAERFQNIAFINSVSKSHGLAGLRVGWIVSKRENLEQFRRGVSNFHTPLFNQKIAAEALGKGGFVRNAREFLDAEFFFLKKKIRASLVRESAVPFYLVNVDDSKEIARKLLERGVSVVDCSTFPGMGREHIRVRIGNREENGMFAEELNVIL